eukprot:scaffold135186_cov68-Attheya_sp.AAC.4
MAISSLMALPQGTKPEDLYIPAMPARVQCEFTSIPLPTHASGQHAMRNDPDLTTIIRSIRQETPLLKKDLINKKYYTEFQKATIEYEDRILYRYETPKHVSLIKQLRVKVAPIAMHNTIIAALHSAMASGHMGLLYKTLWKITAHYWWPGMTKEIRDRVLGCAYCKLPNTMSHEAQVILQNLDTDTPFSIIAMYMYTPGDFPTEWGDTKLLTSLDVMIARISRQRKNPQKQ